MKGRIAIVTQITGKDSSELVDSGTGEVLGLWSSLGVEPVSALVEQPAIEKPKGLKVRDN